MSHNADNYIFSFQPLSLSIGQHQSRVQNLICIIYCVTSLCCVVHQHCSAVSNPFFNINPNPKINNPKVSVVSLEIHVLMRHFYLSLVKKLTVKIIVI